MKIFATDFDGTLNNRPIDDVLLSAIRAWQAAGNLFGVVSGRPYASIRDILNVNHIPLDFLIANNGAIITDGNGDPICLTPIPPSVAVSLLDRFSGEPHHSLRIDDPHVFREYAGIPAYSLTEDGGVRVADDVWHDITEITTDYPTYETTLRETALTEQALGGAVRGLVNSPLSVDWVAGSVNKSYGIKTLVSHLHVTPDVIITAGDSLNDMAMLIDPDFLGYAVENAMPDVRSRVGRTIACCLDILKDI